MGLGLGLGLGFFVVVGRSCVDGEACAAKAVCERVGIDLIGVLGAEWTMQIDKVGSVLRGISDVMKFDRLRGSIYRYGTQNGAAAICCALVSILGFL